MIHKCGSWKILIKNERSGLHTTDTLWPPGGFLLVKCYHSNDDHYNDNDDTATTNTNTNNNGWLLLLLKLLSWLTSLHDLSISVTWEKHDSPVPQLFLFVILYWQVFNMYTRTSISQKCNVLIFFHKLCNLYNDYIIIYIIIMIYCSLDQYTQKCRYWPIVQWVGPVQRVGPVQCVGPVQ